MWRLWRTRHKRERPPPELEENADTSDQEVTPYTFKADQIKGSHTNETINWHICEISSTGEHSFSDCEFPEMFCLRIDQAASLSFVRCKFPKLRQVKIGGENESVFLSCKFFRLTPGEVDLRFYCNCELIGVSPELSYLYEGTGDLEW